MKSLVVIDNFYENPNAVREFALTRVKYVSREKLADTFPGTESIQSYYSQTLLEKIENAIGQKVIADPKTYSFGVFCKTYAADEARRTVHVDQSDWTGLIYLNKPEACVGGTSFYQHRQTGIDRVPCAERLSQMGYKDREDFIERFVTLEGKHMDNWHLSARVGMKCNRLILFRAGEMFHAADGYFGKDDSDCRLTQLFFFKTGESK